MKLLRTLTEPLHCVQSKGGMPASDSVWQPTSHVGVPLARRPSQNAMTVKPGASKAQQIPNVAIHLLKHNLDLEKHFLALPLESLDGGKLCNS